MLSGGGKQRGRTIASVADRNERERTRETAILSDNYRFHANRRIIKRLNDVPHGPVFDRVKEAIPWKKRLAGADQRECHSLLSSAPSAFYHCHSPVVASNGPTDPCRLQAAHHSNLDLDISGPRHRFLHTPFGLWFIATAMIRFLVVPCKSAAAQKQPTGAKRSLAKCNPFRGPAPFRHFI